MTIERVTVAVILVLGVLALAPAGATQTRSEMRTYAGGYRAAGFVCREVGTYDLDLASADTHADLGSACFDLRGEARVHVALRDITGNNVGGYYQFNGCDNCGCDWCPVFDDGSPGRNVDTGPTYLNTGTWWGTSATAPPWTFQQAPRSSR